MNRFEEREQEHAALRLLFARTFVEPRIVEACNDPEAYGLLPNHTWMLGSTDQGVVDVKSRKIAESWGHALYAVADSYVQPRHTNTVISIDEDEAQEKRNFVDWIYDVLPNQVKAEMKMSQGKEEKTIKNGARIQFLSNKPPTGRGATIHLDEFAVPSKSGATPEDILIGALGCTTHAGRVLISSTERDPMTLFHRIVTGEFNDKLEEELRANGDNVAAPPLPWAVRFFPWWSSPALCTDIELAGRLAPMMQTAERVQKFGNERLQRQYRIYITTPGLGLDIFQREFECRVLDERESYFPLDLIRRCEAKGNDFYFEHAEIQGDKETDRALRVIDELATAIKGGLLRGTWAAAMDVARDADMSEITIGHALPEDPTHVILRAIITLNKVEFPQQQKVWAYLMRHISTESGYVDGTKGSVGRQISEWAENEYGQRAKAFEFTSSNRSIVCTGVRSRMEKNALTIPDFEPLRMQMLGVKKKVTAAGTVIFDVQRNKFGHADKFFSLAMLCDLFEEPQQGNAMVVTGTFGQSDGILPRRQLGHHLPKPQRDVGSLLQRSRIILPGRR